MKTIPDIIKTASRDLRKNMTEAETLLWNEIKARQLNWLKFWRQSPTYIYTEDSWLDRYVIPDFLCSEYKLIIELDWSIHNKQDVYLLDREKEKLLKGLWYTILRFQNKEVLENIKWVLQTISTLCSCKE